MLTLFEELNAKQKKKVDSWGESGAADNISRHVFPEGHDRITIPLESAPENPDRQVEPDYRVEDHLKKHGYSVHDYGKGIAKKTITVGNPEKGVPYQQKEQHVNIGKVLQATGAADHIKNAFANDTNRQGIHIGGDHHIIISKHPYDVAGASTDRGWNSCMNMSQSKEAGNQSEQLENDVKYGTHAAYIVHKDDHDINHPVARVMLKPFKSEDSDHTILRPEEKVYGVSSRKAGDAGNIIKNKTQEDLLHSLKKWTDTNYPARPAEVYRKHAGVYDDDLKNLHYDKSQKTLDTIAAHPDEQVRHALTSEHNEYLNNKLSKDKSEYVRQSVARKTNDVETINKLADDASHKVRTAVASRGYRSINNKLAHDPAAAVRASVIASRTHPELDGDYSNDKNKHVTRAVAMHTNNPDVASSLMFHDDDETSDNAHSRHAALTKK